MITAVVLGAGESKRMGEPKLLLPFGERTVVEQIVEELQSSEVGQILVVVGNEADRIRQVLDGKPVRVVENPDYGDGMLSSVRAGLQALPSMTEAVLIVLGDQPSLSSEVVDGMIYAFRGTEKGIVVPKHGARRGHPLLFAKKYCVEVMTEHDDVGLRGLLHAHEMDVFEFPVLSPAVLNDMDTPEDYRRELESRKPSPSYGDENFD